jgi:transcriptional regulator with XRE-family HTH domain
VHPDQPGSLAERLLRLRKEAGLTGAQLSDALGWEEGTGRTKVSKIENGRQQVTENDIRAWARATGHPEQAEDLLDLLASAKVVRTRWRQQRLGGGQAAAVQQARDRTTQAATRIRNAENVIIPGLLQTSGYARSIIAQASALYGAVDVDAALQARMQRQQVLYDTSKMFEFVFTEAALYLLPCSRQVMLGQLDRLLSLGMDNVMVGIIPFGTELPLAPYNSFLLLDDDLTVETLAGKDEERADDSAELYHRIFDLLMAGALTGDDARRLITTAAERLREST